MDRLINYVCEELKDLERKVEYDGKLSMSEIVYADTLAHLEKNLLKAEEMGNEMNYMSFEGMSNARGRNARRDSRGRYSRNQSNRSSRSYNSYRGYSMDNDEMISKLEEMQEGADEEQKQLINRWIKQIQE